LQFAGHQQGLLDQESFQRGVHFDGMRHRRTPAKQMGPR
jgi:hypothetical protein